MADSEESLHSSFSSPSSDPSDLPSDYSLSFDSDEINSDLDSEKINANHNLIVPETEHHGNNAENQDNIVEDSLLSESDENFSFNHLLPLVGGNMDSTMKAALLYYWQLTSSVSDASMNRILKLIFLLCPNSGIPQSVFTMKSLTKNIFAENAKPAIEITIGKSKIFLLDFDSQMKILISHFHSLIIQYSMHLKSSSNTDILNSAAMKNTEWQCTPETLDLFFLASTDGGAFTQNTDLDIWPFQLELLNLPPSLRQSAENILLLALISGNGKPSLKECLPHVLKHLPHQMLINGITVNIHCNLFVCDLPALATVFNVKQFNGKFPCPKCLHPGQSSSVGRVRILPYSMELKHSIPLRCDDKHLIHVASASNGHPVYGVKGESALDERITFPSGYVIDTMHCLFEGQIKFILSCLSNTKLRHLPCFLVPQQLSAIHNILGVLKVPIEYSFKKCSNSSSFSVLWKAHELRFFSFHLLLPLVLPVSSNSDLQYLLSSLVAIYHLLYSSHSDIKLIEELTHYFLENATKVFPESILRLNFHLLTHLADQYTNHGPVYLTSMFVFESMMKVYKGFISGSQCQANQIASKTVNFKLLTHALKSCTDSNVTDAFKTVNFTTHSCLNISSRIISDNVAVWHNKFLHSFSYDSSLQSSSCYVVLNCGITGYIEKFEKPDCIFIFPFNKQPQSLFDKYLAKPLHHHKHISYLISHTLSKCKTFKYNLFGKSFGGLIKKKLDDVLFRAIVVKISEDLLCISPLVEVQEHS